MDHILEHESDPIPDLANAAIGSAAPAAAHGHQPQNAMDVDDDEDGEALRAALKLSQSEGSGASAPAPSEGGGAKVRHTLVQSSEERLKGVGRASSAQSAERSSEMLMRPISTRQNPGMTNLKSPPRRSAHLSSTSRPCPNNSIAEKAFD